MAKLYFLPREALKDRDWILRLGWRIESALIAALLGTLGWLRLDRSTRVASWLCRHIGPCTSLNTKLLRNLAILHPAETIDRLERRAANTFGWVGVAVAEITHLPEIVERQEELVEFVCDPSVEAVLRDPGAPAVLVTGHVGPWTLTNLVASHYGFPLTIVYAPESNPGVRERILNLRSAMPVKLIERDGSMRALLADLRAGGKIGLATDIRADGGEPIPLCGHPMETSTVPARLALRQDCPLIPVRAERLPGGRFRIVVEAAVQPDDPDADPETRMLSMMRNLSAVYERWIRTYEDQWLCMARRWPKELDKTALQRTRDASRR